MRLFDFFKKKENAKAEVFKEQEQQIESYESAIQFPPGKEYEKIFHDRKTYIVPSNTNDAPQDKSNFIDNLVNSFNATNEITDATFGYTDTYHYSSRQSQRNLVLAVGLKGNEETIESMIQSIKSLYLPAIVIRVVSSQHNLKLYNEIKEMNFLFYEKNKKQLLNQAIMKQYFSGVNFDEIIDTLKQRTVFTLVRDYNKWSNRINCQTYFHCNREYIPLYSEKKMLKNSSMAGIPRQIRQVELDWQKINSGTVKKEDRRLFILNPNTAFEAQFFA